MNDIQALVGAAFGRLIAGGIGVAEQDREDVLQAGYVGALEAAQRWVPEQGAFSTLISARATGAMLDRIRTDAMGGIGEGRNSDALTRYGEDETTDIDEVAGEMVPLGDRQVYEWTPAGFDPVVETDALSVVYAVEQLPSPERETVKALYGIGGPEMTAVDLAALEGVSDRTIWRRANAALTRLGYRETAAPDEWAAYREAAFRKGAGATKAANPPRFAGRPYRRGRNSLWDPREARLTRASNRKAWLAAGRRANGRLSQSA